MLVKRIHTWKESKAQASELLRKCKRGVVVLRVVNIVPVKKLRPRISQLLKQEQNSLLDVWTFSALGININFSAKTQVAQHYKADRRKGWVQRHI